MRAKWVGSLAVTLYGISILAPLLWVLITSFKSADEIFSSPWGLPKTPQWSNYSQAWTQANLGPAFLNSLFVVAGTLVLLLPVGTMAAYVFSRFPFRGSKALFTVMIAQMMLPNFIVVVPLFMLLRTLGLLDTRLGLIIVYVAYSLSFTIFVMSGMFSNLPKELDEAATLDGCGYVATFRRIMLPLARPGLIVVAIFNGIGLWNEYQLALVLVNSPENRTLPLGIADLAMTQHYSGNWGALFAGLVIVMTPLMAVYWVFKDRIHQAMLAGAVKG